LIKAWLWLLIFSYSQFAGDIFLDIVMPGPWRDFSFCSSSPINATYDILEFIGIIIAYRRFPSTQMIREYSLFSIVTCALAR